MENLPSTLGFLDRENSRSRRLIFCLSLNEEFSLIMCFVVVSFSFIVYLLLFKFFFVQRKKHFIFVCFLFQSYIFRFNYKFSILHNVDYFRLQNCI